MSAELNQIANTLQGQFSLHAQEEHVILGYHALQQYIIGSTLGTLYEFPLNYLLAFGSNNFLIKLIAELVAMSFNACGIIFVMGMYRNSPFHLSLIPFQMGLVSHQPTFQKNSEEIVNDLTGWVFSFLGTSMPTVMN